MKKNAEYVLHNAQGIGNLVDWLMCLNNFFGEEKTDEFCDYYIHAHQILRKEDIRNLLPCHSLSVYWAMGKEQLAFVSSYHLIDRKSKFVQNRGVQKIQKFYRKKDVELAKKIKQMGYSYVAIEANWKDKMQKDTYQRDYVFCIFSETDTAEEFQQNMIELAKFLQQDKIFLTDTFQEKGPKYQISSKVYDTAGKVLEEYSNTGIETIEKYLSMQADTKVVFKIPYEKNKTIESCEVPQLRSHYAWQKREKVANATVHSFNMGMLKQSLLQSFRKSEQEN